MTSKWLRWAATAAFVLGCCPVSYTHLDVYKRQLRDSGMSDCLGLLHFHMGSQISNVRDIANGMREAVRYFIELSTLGATCLLYTSRCV